jgi:hypothetical protein
MFSSKNLRQDSSYRHATHVRSGSKHFGVPAISDLFPDLLRVLDGLLVTALDQIYEAAEEAFFPFVAGATSYKHQGFKEESEVRIVAIPG